MVKDILAVILRDLNVLEKEISAYKVEDDLWKVLPGTTNSAGNLTLHLVGNLRHFIGAELGNSGYLRNRELEFSTKNISLEELKKSISKCRTEITVALTDFDNERLEMDFPKEFAGVFKSTSYVLIHLTVHLGYHLGQINYHRRYFSEPA